MIYFFISRIFMHKKKGMNSKQLVENLELIEDIEFLDEMEGERFSNHPANVKKYGFQFASLEEIAFMLRDVDLVIPF